MRLYVLFLFIFVTNREMQAVETRSLSLMEQLRVASEERSQLERAAGDSSALVKNLTAQYEAKLRELTAERDSLAKMVQDQKAELASMRQRLMESETKNQSLQLALDEERRKREALEKKYKEMEEEFNRQRRAWEDDRARLLARIKEYVYITQRRLTDFYLSVYLSVRPYVWCANMSDQA